MLKKVVISTPHWNPGGGPLSTPRVGDEVKFRVIPYDEDGKVIGPLIRKRPLALHELEFAQTLTDKPVKIALPGPYLLTRTMWMECISDRAYDSRESLAR